MLQPTDAFRLAELIATDFYENRLDLSARGGAASSPWSRLPEVECVRALRRSGGSDRTVRLFVTFIAAMDRARDSTRLWRAGLALFESHPDLFDPAQVSALPIADLRNLLSAYRVSQRHRDDTRYWSTIASSLASGNGPVSEAVDRGVGDAQELLVDLKTPDNDGAPAFRCCAAPRSGRCG